jgi:hypothetical protein
MESTKVVSLRIPYMQYEKIVLECEKKGITVTEFFERKIAMANSIKEFKKEITQKIESAVKSIDSSTTLAKIKLRGVLDILKIN